MFLVSYLYWSVLIPHNHYICIGYIYLNIIHPMILCLEIAISGRCLTMLVRNPPPSGLSFDTQPSSHAFDPVFH